LKLNGTHQLLVYAAGVNILGGSVKGKKGKVIPLQAQCGPEGG